MTTKALIISLVFLFVFFHPSISQEFEWDQYNCSEFVTAIAFEDNIVWAGTSAGLTKYNKTTQEVKYFDNADYSAPLKDIWDIAVDQSGNKWLATPCGLVKYDDSDFSLHPIEPYSWPYSHLRCVEVDNNGLVWVSLLNLAGIYTWDGNAFTFISSNSSGIGIGKVRDIKADQYGNIWVANQNGLHKFDGENWTYFNTINTNIPVDEIKSVTIENENTVWVAVDDNGIAKLDIPTNTYTIYNTSNSGIIYDHTENIEIDSQGNVWVQSAKGLILFDGYSFTTYKNDNSDLPWNVILALEVDNNDVIWLGCRGMYYSGGFLTSLDNGQWAQHDISTSGLPQGFISAVSEDKLGNIWVGNHGSEGTGGISMFDKENEWAVYNKYNAPGELAWWIMKMKFDDHNNLWAGVDGGLLKFDGVDWTVYDNTNSPLPNNNWVRTLEIDHLNNIWVGTGVNELLKFDGDNWSVYDSASCGLNIEGGIQDIRMDSDNNIWVISSGGISKYDGYAWTHYTEDNSAFQLNSFSSLTIDQDGMLWMGILYSGVIKFDGMNFTQYTAENSNLPSNTTYDIEVDKNNKVWVATGEGISCFDGNDWSDAYNMCNSGLSNMIVKAIHVDNDSIMWFGTREGLTRYGKPSPSGINDENKNTDPMEVLVYPNPASSHISIVHDLDKNAIANIKIYDIKGSLIRVIEDVEIPDQLINTSNLNQGSYFLKITFEGGYHVTKKLVII